MGTEISEPTRTHSNQQLEPTRDRKRQKVKPRTMALLFDTVFDLADLVFRHPFAPSSCGSKRKQCVPGSMAKRQQWPKIDLLEEGGSQGKTLRRERYFRSFTRTVPLPEGVDKDK